MVTLIGQTLGRYRLEELIGQGGMAQVFKAWDPNTGRYVAIKVLHQHLIDEDGFKERFDREGKLIASLHHANIVSIYDYDQQETDTGTIHFMVMPYITGLTLKARLQDLSQRDELMSNAEIIRIIEGIARALDYAHAKDMIHRDIKPANILFDEDDNPLLTDFGLARLTFGERLTQSGVTSGTPAYMAPEQGLGQPGDYRSDIYSLGIILHELLTNRLPFTADSSLGLLMKHINEPLPAPSSIVPDISPAVEAVVYRATAKEPEGRYETASTMAEELRAALVGADISTQTEHIANQQRQSEKQARPWKKLSLAAGGLLLIIVLIIVLTPLLEDTIATPPPTVAAVNSMSAGPVPFSTNFEEGDEFSDWPLLDEGSFTTSLENGQYILSATERGLGHTAIYFPDYFQYESMILETTATLSPDSQPDSGFGLVFRYQNPDNYYVFTINGQQEASIWALENGNWRELRGLADTWTTTDAVNPRGTANSLKINTTLDHFIAYVNDEAVFAVDDETYSVGGVGLYIATSQRPVDEALTEVAFDDFSVTTRTPSMSNSDSN
ncbi:serine/threonine protein kinase [Chloroflexota bacterium]